MQIAAMLRGSGGIALKALLLVLARTDSLVPEGGILRGRVHVVLEGDATPPPGDAVQVVLGTSETAAGGWGDGAHPSTALCLEWLSERGFQAVSYTHLRAHETGRNLVCRLLLEKK